MITYKLTVKKAHNLYCLLEDSNNLYNLYRKALGNTKSTLKYSGSHSGLELLGTSFQELVELPGSNTMATPARIQCSAVWEHLMGKVTEQHCRALGTREKRYVD